MINSEIGELHNNSDYTDADGGVGAVSRTRASCTRPTNLGGRAWTDVKAKERDLPSLFGGSGFRCRGTRARAHRVRPAVSGKKFMPLAIPNNVITKVQVRYYDECRNQLILDSTKNLHPCRTELAATVTTASAPSGACPRSGGPSEGDPNVGFGLTSRSTTRGCGGRGYLPVGIEVRIASRNKVDFNQTCAQLLAMRFADCFRGISLIRVWDDGDPNNIRGSRT